MTTRPRAMSGTIPSMESSHDELKDNTIIIGTILLDRARTRVLASTDRAILPQSWVHLEISQRRK